MDSYFAIVTHGSPSRGDIKSCYRSKARAILDALLVGGGSCTSVRVVECDSAAAAKAADISDGKLAVVWSR